MKLPADAIIIIIKTTLIIYIISEYIVSNSNIG